MTILPQGHLTLICSGDSLMLNELFLYFDPSLVHSLYLNKGYSILEFTVQRAIKPLEKNSPLPII